MINRLIYCMVCLLFYVFAKGQTVTQQHISIPDGKLFGSLHLPEKSGPIPVVLILAGSGRTDRYLDKDKSYAMLADSLNAYGIAALCVDKRTAGKSFENCTNFDSLTFDDFIDDAVAWINHLNVDERFSQTVVLGHSQGSTVAILAAQQTKVDKLISLAGPSVRIDDGLREQMYDNLLNKMMLEPLVEPVLESMRNGLVQDSVHDLIKHLFDPKNQPFFMSWMVYDPVVEIKKLNIPIMLINGTTDFQVKVHHAEALKAAYPDAKLLIVENMNHVLKPCETIDKLPNMRVYGKPDIAIVGGWVDQLAYFIHNN